jgi:hypothetical protein
MWYVGVMYSQTTISPFIGYDFAEFKTHSMPDDLLAVSFHFTGKGYSARSLLAGIEINQYLGWRIAVAASFSLTRKTMDAVEYNITDLQAIQLVTHRNNVSINYLLLNNVSIGCGYDYNYLSNFKKGLARPLVACR